MNENVDLRKSENYKQTKEIFDNLFTNIQISGKSLHPLLPTRYADFRRNCLDFYETWQEAKKISNILRIMKSAIAYPDSKVSAMSKMLAYLGLVESLGVALSDMALIFLMANGRDVHTTRGSTKHVTSVSELRDVDLGAKLELLKDEKLSLFKYFINQDVRNHIAHLKFRIEINGEIRRLDNSPIDIDKAISEFWEGVDILNLVFEDIGFFKWLEEERARMIGKIEKNQGQAQQQSIKGKEGVES